MTDTEFLIRQPTFFGVNVPPLSSHVLRNNGANFLTHPVLTEAVHQLTVVSIFVGESPTVMLRLILFTPKSGYYILQTIRKLSLSESVRLSNVRVLFGIHLLSPEDCTITFDNANTVGSFDAKICLMAKPFRIQVAFARRCLDSAEDVTQQVLHLNGLVLLRTGINTSDYSHVIPMMCSWHLGQRTLLQSSLIRCPHNRRDQCQNPMK